MSDQGDEGCEQLRNVEALEGGVSFLRSWIM
jgi:hypothetical protein